MKTRLIKSSLLFLIIFFPSLTHAQLEKAEFQASGLTCSLCSNAINKALKTIPFIEAVNTDLNKNIFQITFKKNVIIDIDLIKKKVEDAGFSIAKFWIIENLHDLKIENDQHALIDGTYFHFMHVKSQTLNGENRLQIIDKDFVAAKEFKKYSAYTSMPCYQTGMMSDCCKSHGSRVSPARIYHVTI